MTDKHTPGPWIAVSTKRESSNLHIMTVEGYGIANMFDKGSIDDQEMVANATLIASAPTMLSALIMADEALEEEGYEADGQYRKTILAAIAQARGEA